MSTPSRKFTFSLATFLSFDFTSSQSFLLSWKSLLLPLLPCPFSSAASTMEEASSAVKAPEADAIPQVDGGANEAPGDGDGDGDGIKEPEWDVIVELADQQADPSNPLFSIKGFNELNL
jgi:hypothetical protein